MWRYPRHSPHRTALRRSGGDGEYPGQWRKIVKSWPPRVTPPAAPQQHVHRLQHRNHGTPIFRNILLNAVNGDISGTRTEDRSCRTPDRRGSWGRTACLYADRTVMPSKAGGVRVATVIDHAGRHNGAGHSPSRKTINASGRW